MRKKTLILAFFALQFFVSCCLAEEKPTPALEKGIGQYKHENYEEALATLKKARQEDPQSTLAAFYLGLTYKKIQDYQASLEPLREAVTNTPKIKEALMELIDSLYQLGELEEAKKWIAEAETQEIKPAQTAFLKGLVLARDNQDGGAIESFKRAKELDPAMSQGSDYQIGLIHLKKKEFSRAQEIFKDVVVVNPNSTMANFANQYLDILKERGQPARPFKLDAGFAWQYDDNVAVKPEDISIETNISGKSDWRHVYTMNTEYNHNFSDTFNLRAQYSFYDAEQHRMHFYDMMSQTFTIQPNFTSEKTLLSFPTGYNHVWVNDTTYLSMPTFGTVYNFMTDDKNMGQLTFRYNHKNYMWTPSSADENRDSNDFGSGFGWYRFYAKNKGFVSLRYGINKEETKGKNWDYLGNRVTAAAVIPFSGKLNLTLSADFYAQNFSHTNSTYLVKRHDRTYTGSALLAYKIYKDSEFQIQYTRIRDCSNIDVYDYSRNIYSAGFNVKF
ncbi:MAG: tetratricopeptide repeat protein [Candidatus Omnitrophica bacterium]|nr:tetratricopeptide repeat protein [Candidatus Omnitrophota bacterium]